MTRFFPASMLPYLWLCASNVVVQAKDVYFNLELEAVLENELSPDCMNIQQARRYMFLANRQMPGPLIEADEGDMVHVQVTNKHPTESVAIHWHGIHQRGTPYMDGPGMVTQCNLGVKQSQEYVFEAYPAGTHYWHAHGSLHLADGLSGPIIVHPKDSEPFEYDDERTIYLQDWYAQTSTQQLIGLMNFPFTWIGNPNSLLINGKGLAPECLEGGQSFNNSLVCLETCQDEPLPTIDVEAGKTYRFRLINAGQLVMMNFAITDHAMVIVQVEGTNVEPVTVPSLDLSPGQRYDVLVTMEAIPGVYWMETTVRQRDIPDIQGQALLQYSGVDPYTPQDFPKHPEWDDVAYGIQVDKALLTLNPSAHPEAVALDVTDVTRYVVVGTQNQVIVDGEPERLVWAVNNMTNIKGDTPLIGAAYDTSRRLGWPSEIPDTHLLSETPPFKWDYTQDVNDPGGPGPAVDVQGQIVIELQKDQVVEIILQNARALNGVAEFHPWHIHGHSFWVVGSGDGIYDPSLVDTYNLDNPLLRDTVDLWPLQWTAVRFVADSPGTWLFHCHITAHLVMGMGFSMVVAPDMLEEPSESVRACDDTSLLAGSGGSDSPTNGGAMATLLVMFATASSLVLLGG